jgi:nitric oxide reductase subunit C
MSSSVIRGKHIWEDNNCMGCHTLFGEGAYYAPELTKVYSRRGEAFIKIFLKDPQAMYPGKRKMVKYNFAEHELSDLVEFFKWINDVDVNGFPAKTYLGSNLTNVSSGGSSTVPSGIKQPAVVQQICMSCHKFGGVGGSVGPVLDGVGERRDAVFLKKWITDPKSVKADALMPKLPLTEATIDELVTYLSALK